MVQTDVDNLQAADRVKKLIYRQFVPLYPLIKVLIIDGQVAVWDMLLIRLKQNTKFL